MESTWATAHPPLSAHRGIEWGAIGGNSPPKIQNSHPHLKKAKFLGGAFPPRSDL